MDKRKDLKWSYFCSKCFKLFDDMKEDPEICECGGFVDLPNTTKEYRDLYLCAEIKHRLRNGSIENEPEARKILEEAMERANGYCVTDKRKG